MKIRCTCGEGFTCLPTWKDHNRTVHGGRGNFEVLPDPGDKTPNVRPTPRLADECKKLLDNGWDIQLFKNQLGSYTACCNHPNGGSETTDDFEPSASLYRLTEKVFGNIV